MKLSPTAQQELKEILRSDYGEGLLKRLTEEQQLDLGIRLLKLTACVLKAEARRASRLTQTADK